MASLHNSYWASGFVPGGAIKRAIRTLDGRFWRHTADATLCVSPECQRQVESLARQAAIGPCFNTAASSDRPISRRSRRRRRMTSGLSG